MALPSLRYRQSKKHQLLGGNMYLRDTGGEPSPSCWSRCPGFAASGQACQFSRFRHTPPHEQHPGVFKRVYDLPRAPLRLSSFYVRR